jgi:hypothetical protein
MVNATNVFTWAAYNVWLGRTLETQFYKEKMLRSPIFISLQIQELSSYEGSIIEAAHENVHSYHNFQ